MSLTVYATDHPPVGAWSTAQALLPQDVTLRFAPILVSRDQAAELSAYLNTRWETQGLDLVSWGLDIQTGKFRVALRSGALTAEDHRQLARFGPNTYYVVTTDGSPSGLPI